MSASADDSSHAHCLLLCKWVGGQAGVRVNVSRIKHNSHTICISFVCFIMSSKRIAAATASAMATATTAVADSIVVRDPTILAFYKENPNLDFVAMNHAFIDILKKLSVNLNETVMSNLHTTLIQNIAQLNTQLTSVKQDIQKTETTLLLKLAEQRRDIVEDIKLVFANQSLSHYEKLELCINKSKVDIAGTLRQLLSDTTAQSGDQFMKIVETKLATQQSAVLAELVALKNASGKSDTFATDLIQHMNTQFQQLQQTLPSLIQNMLQSSEHRTCQSMDAMKEKMAIQASAHGAMTEQMNAFLNRYKHNSSSKGLISEEELFVVLQTVFPSDEILDTRAETAACDYRIHRRDTHRPTLLFENKDYERPVSKDEVKKFERDLAVQNHHGIFLSQKSGISLKENFQIDVIHGRIHLYLTHVQYDIEKIKTAVAIVDHLHTALRLGDHNHPTTADGNSSHTFLTANTNITYVLSTEDIHMVLEEYQTFIKQKDGLMDHLKQSHTTTVEMLEKITMANIFTVLTKHGLVKAEDALRCLYCDFVGKNRASITQHIKRHCKSSANPNTRKNNATANANATTSATSVVAPASNEGCTEADGTNVNVSGSAT